MLDQQLFSYPYRISDLFFFRCGDGAYSWLRISSSSIISHGSCILPSKRLIIMWENAWILRFLLTTTYPIIYIEQYAVSIGYRVGPIDTVSKSDPIVMAS